MLFPCVTKHACDGQTNRQNYTTPKTALALLHSSRGKNGAPAVDLSPCSLYRIFRGRLDHAAIELQAKFGRSALNHSRIKRGLQNLENRALAPDPAIFIGIFFYGLAILCFYCSEY